LVAKTRISLGKNRGQKQTHYVKPLVYNFSGFSCIKPFCINSLIRVDVAEEGFFMFYLFFKTIGNIG